MPAITAGIRIFDIGLFIRTNYSISSIGRENSRYIIAMRSSAFFYRQDGKLRL